MPCIKAFHSFTLDTASVDISKITNSYVQKTTYDTDLFSSKNENGYQKLPGGVMLQWGKIIDSQNSLKDQKTGSFNFNIPFKSTCYSFNATKNAGGASTFDNFIQIVSLTKDNFNVLKQEAYGGNDNITEFYWFAIGDWK